MGTAYYFHGVDPAPAATDSADDGASAVLRATERFSRELTEDDDPMRVRSPSEFKLQFVYARAIRRASIRQWSGHVYQVHDAFQVRRVVIDAGAGGGGQYLRAQMRERRQLIGGLETDCTPIITQDELNVVVGRHDLVMFKRGDPAIEQLWPKCGDEGVLLTFSHGEFREALENTWIQFPPGPAEFKREMGSWPQARVDALKHIAAGVKQLSNIVVATNEEGKFLISRHGGKKFGAKGKKDIAYAMMYAYVGFLTWLRAPDLWGSGGESGDAGFSGW